jgi:hypothetical protein
MTIETRVCYVGIAGHLQRVRWDVVSADWVKLASGIAKDQIEAMRAATLAMNKLKATNDR